MIDKSINDKIRIEQLETTLAAMIKPAVDIPFSVVMRVLSGFGTVDLEENEDDQALINGLEESIRLGYFNNDICNIESKRVNEVGNYMEEPLMQAINDYGQGLQAERPTDKQGNGKSSGYPDILVYDKQRRPTYVEVKTYNKKSLSSTHRSFYLSPSDSFKVTMEARHLLIGFEMEESADNKSSVAWNPVAWKIVNLHNIKCIFKQEFNTNNKHLYDSKFIKAEGNLEDIK